MHNDKATDVKLPDTEISKEYLLEEIKYLRKRVSELEALLYRERYIPYPVPQYVPNYPIYPYNVWYSSDTTKESSSTTKKGR